MALRGWCITASYLSLLRLYLRVLAFQHLDKLCANVLLPRLWRLLLLAVVQSQQAKQPKLQWCTNLLSRPSAQKQNSHFLPVHKRNSRGGEGIWIELAYVYLYSSAMVLFDSFVPVIIAARMTIVVVSESWHAFETRINVLRLARFRTIDYYD